MTRETKIGLLVGLAFIIVIGVLLSDHIQSATQPQPAPIVVTPENVDKSMLSPGKQNPGAVAVRAPETVSPAGMVATNESMTHARSTETYARSPEPVVVVSRGDGGPIIGEATQATDQSGPNVLLTHETSRPTDAAQTGGVQIGPATGAATTLAATGPVVVETPDRNLKMATTGRSGDSENGTATRTTSESATKYTAVAGDSIYRMTVKFYGGYSKSREALIVAANPQMGGNASKISVGKVYNIPALAGTTVATKTDKTATATATSTASPSKPEPKPARAGKAYVVKDGDSLWKIASSTGHSVAELRLANKDQLKGGETLRPGMTLKIPAEKLASAE